jgi:STAS domain-containing protein
MAGCHLRERRRFGAARFPVIRQLPGCGRNGPPATCCPGTWTPGLAASGRPLVADLDQVRLIDSAGLAALTGAASRAAAHGGSLHVVCALRPALATDRSRREHTSDPPGAPSRRLTV